MNYPINLFFNENGPIQGPRGSFVTSTLKAMHELSSALRHADLSNLRRISDTLKMPFDPENKNGYGYLYNQVPTDFIAPALACMMLGAQWHDVKEITRRTHPQRDFNIITDADHALYVRAGERVFQSVLEEFEGDYSFDKDADIVWEMIMDADRLVFMGGLFKKEYEFLTSLEQSDSRLLSIRKHVLMS